MVSKDANGSIVGIKDCGIAHMLRIMLGSTAAGLLTETRSDVKMVIVGGYSKGAGSKSEGSLNASARDGCRWRCAQSVTRRG